MTDDQAQTAERVAQLERQVVDLRCANAEHLERVRHQEEAIEFARDQLDNLGVGADGRLADDMVTVLDRLEEIADGLPEGQQLPAPTSVIVSARAHAWEAYHELRSSTGEQVDAAELEELCRACRAVLAFEGRGG